MANRYLGFYWTLPVNWAGFRRLPDNVEAAAEASKTIRYQRERVRRFVADERGILVDEIAFLDVQPDRATDLVRQELQGKAAQHAGSAILITVAFEEVHLWRHNPYLTRAARELGFELLQLPPDPIIIEGVEFDPSRHFSRWRKRDRSMKAQLEYGAHQGLLAALVAVPAAEGRWRSIAEWLNNQGIKTIRGGNWTPENARKLTGRLHAPQGIGK